MEGLLTERQIKIFFNSLFMISYKLFLFASYVNILTYEQINVVSPAKSI